MYFRLDLFEFIISKKDRINILLNKNTRFYPLFRNCIILSYQIESNFSKLPMFPQVFIAKSKRQRQVKRERIF